MLRFCLVFLKSFHFITIFIILKQVRRAGSGVRALPAGPEPGGAKAPIPREFCEEQLRLVAVNHCAIALVTRYLG